MKIIDAIWEKRNLGVETVEFEVDANDDSLIIKEILENEKQYNVVKIPSHNFAVTQAVQQIGYRFAESMIYFVIKPGELKLNSIQKRIIDSIEITTMNEYDIAELHDEIEKNIFDTDRIYCDPHFTKVQAANRYWGWINDEQNRGGRLLKHVHNGENVGFAGVTSHNSIYLEGMYSKAKRGGFGIVIPYLVYQVGIENGESKMYGVVSSTNTAVMRMYTQIGFNLDRVINIMVKNK